MTRLYIYADDSMLGRDASTAGNVKATDYIAAQVRRMGLQPAGDSGSYFQTIPLKSRTLDTASMFTVPGGPLVAFTDYVPLVRQPAANDTLGVVFGGMVGDTLHQLTEEQAAGKLVVLRSAGFNSLRALRRAPTVAGAWGALPSWGWTACHRPSWRGCGALKRSWTTTRSPPLRSRSSCS
jgi:hypothetical protein